MYAFVTYGSNIGNTEPKDCWIILKDANLLSDNKDILEGIVVDQYKPKKTSSPNPWQTPSVGQMPSIQVPLIRRTFPQLITNDIVSVQPMSGPVGLAFALRYKYEDKAGDPDKSRYSKSSYTWILYETMDDLIAANFTDLL